jgi:hypothetical protein
MKEIPLTKGQVALVDDEDYDRVMQYNWYYNDMYAIRALPRINGKQYRQNLSNFIMQVPNSVMLDHKDRKPLNNQKYNLRQCTFAQNARNIKLPTGTSKYRGVTYYHDKRRNKPPCWQARIRVNNKSIFLGYFDDPVIAAQTYDVKAHELHGEFAVLNFPR